ncbi:hypothetical protein ACFQAT_15460 [Undibacterium arcticum]|uniref:Uncharacterized protein n=1 Tax=Undibacterium arcticum TaxID=1762892 RepID=A0ABV7EXF5_9BURK
MSIINPGVVSWSGENPGIYLKDPAHLSGPWITLALYFKVVISPFGRGRGILVIGAPDTPAGYPEVPNLCIADNLPLMRYLLGEFVPCFGAFRNVPALSHVSLHQASGGGSDTSEQSRWGETLKADGVELTLNWSGLQQPFAADVGPDLSATGKHQMYSVFQGADRGEILLNGQGLPGVVIERDFLGGRLNSAFLAFAESWVEPTGDARE